MKAKLLTDALCPDFLYDIKDLDWHSRTVKLCWTSRDYNECVHPLDRIQLVSEEYPNRQPITHVAIRFQGKVWALPGPNRHHDVIHHIVEQTGTSYVDSHGEDQGFLDSVGNYLNRKQALLNAQLNGQMRQDRPIWHNELYSENLW